MKTKRYTNKKFNVLGVRVPLVFACFIVCSIILSVLMAIFASGRSSELMAMEKAISQIERENKDVVYILINETSLVHITEKVENLAMRAPQEVIYLNNLQPAFAKLP